jgi:hypothetical protein
MTASAATSSHRRGGLQGRPRLGAQPRDAGQDGVADRPRDLLAAGGEHLRGEERVAAGTAVKLIRVGIGGGAVRQLPDRLAGQRLKIHPGNPGSRGQITKQQRQRTARLCLLGPVGDDDQDRQPLHPAGQEADQLQGRLVGPVHVFEDQNDGMAQRAKLRHHPGEQVAPRPGAVEQPGEAGAQRGRHVQQRPERQRGGKGIAGPGEDRRLPHAAHEPPDQGGLPDARLTAHEDQAALTTGGTGHRLREPGELPVTPQQEPTVCYHTEPACRSVSIKGPGDLLGTAGTTASVWRPAPHQARPPAPRCLPQVGPGLPRRAATPRMPARPGASGIMESK